MSTARKKAFANCDAASLLRLLTAANIQFSNRNIPLLEFRLTYSKQTIAIVSNRNIFGVRLS
jgi:hypothetical protein